MTDAYLTEITEWYSGGYRGTYTPSSELAEIIPRAYDIVNNSIFMSGYEADSVPEYMSGAVKNAICAQVDFIYGHGGVAGLSSGESAGSMSLGSFSYSDGKAESMTADRLSVICAQARSFLLPVGLLRKGVGTV